MSLYNEGVYRAKILDYGIQTTQKGDPKVFVEFQIKDPEGNYGKITWNSGFYSQEGTEITVKNLITMGLQDPEKIHLMADGIPSKILDVQSIYDVTVIQKPHHKYQNQIVNEVRFINHEGQGQLEVKRMDKGSAQSRLASLGIGAAFHNIKHKEGQGTVAPSQDGVFGGHRQPTLDDIPF